SGRSRSSSGAWGSWPAEAKPVGAASGKAALGAGAVGVSGAFGESDTLRESDSWTVVIVSRGGAEVCSAGAWAAGAASAATGAGVGSAAATGPQAAAAAGAGGVGGGRAYSDVV